jgi:hypothetical protein
MKCQVHRSDHTPVPAGAHSAICIAVIDLGIQPGSARFPTPRRQVYLRFELPDTRIEYQRDGQSLTGPMTIGRRFSASLSPTSNLRQFVESWRGLAFTDAQAADFDLRALIGQRCLLSITHLQRDGQTRAIISGVMALPRTMREQHLAPQHNPSEYYNTEHPDPEVLRRLPGWLQELIQTALGATPAPNAVDAGELHDDIPFVWASTTTALPLLLPLLTGLAAPAGLA